MADVITLFDSDYHEIGPALINCDIETGNEKCTNDFEITSILPANCYGICILGTDAGGVIEYTEAISNKTPTKKGFTWRGLLKQIVLCPPSGSDYLTITNKDLNAAIKDILSGALGGFFTVPSTPTITVSSYQFELYTNALSGLMDLCKSVGYKLYVHADKSDALGKIVVTVESKPINYLDGEYSEESVMQLNFIKNGMGTNHMICMGQGELQERQRVDLYLQPDGTISKTQYYFGFDERQYYYDDSAAQDLETLEKEGREYFPDIASGNKLEINSEPESLEIGDVVRGKYKSEGIEVEAAVNKKIYRISGYSIKKEYEITEVT